MSLPIYTPRNILVTGGAGFIGANFIRHFLSRETQANIINLDLLTYAGSLKKLDNLPKLSQYHFIEGDIANVELVADSLREFNIDTVVHFAAESHVDRSIEDPVSFMQTNIMGTFILLETVRQYWLNKNKWSANQCRFHHISTDEVYGSLSKEEAAFTEKNAYSPNSPYSASKASSDHLVRAYFHTYHLPVTLSLCSNNYGPYQHAEKFIPTVIRSCYEWQPIPVYGDGSNIRDWLYVEDHCRGIVDILTKGRVGESYHLGGQAEWDNVSVAKMICQVMDELYPRQQSHASLITFVADRPGHDWRYAMNISKISSELRWKPTESFVSGLRKTVAHFLSIFTQDKYVFP